MSYNPEIQTTLTITLTAKEIAVLRDALYTAATKYRYGSSLNNFGEHCWEQIMKLDDKFRIALGFKE